ncbi:MAG: lysylphosphatidylglycerol synthase transmembrane domain-containing protein [Lysobacterales bacterium]
MTAPDRDTPDGDRVAADAANGNEGARDGAPHLRRAGAVLLLGALLATLAVPIVFGGRAALDEALAFPLRDWLALLACAFASSLARSVKLQWLVRQLGVLPGFRHTLGITLATDCAFMATPVGIGGYAASVYYLRGTGIRASGAAAVTAADQALDLVFFALALPVAGAFEFGTRLPHEWGLVALGGGAAMLVLAAAAWLVHRRFEAWLADDQARWPRQRAAIRGFLAGLRHNAKVLLRGGPLLFLGTFALTALQWLTRYAVLWLALALLGHEVSFALTWLLQAIVLNAAQWAGLPAGGGGADIGLGAALAAWVPSTELATALLLWRVATLYFGLVIGIGAIAWLARRRARSRAQAESRR